MEYLERMNNQSVLAHVQEKRPLSLSKWCSICGIQVENDAAWKHPGKVRLVPPKLDSGLIPFTGLFREKPWCSNQ
jgi:hypothetical protein